VLDGDGVQLVVHQIPDFIAKTITITSPPERRSETALKFFFTVPSIAEAGVMSRSLGGSLDDEEWEGSGFRVRNAVDPEGNVFQIRETIR
jgi:predicted enzyme related to lactoylglutathione lyase